MCALRNKGMAWILLAGIISHCKAGALAIAWKMKTRYQIAYCILIILQGLNPSLSKLYIVEGIKIIDTCKSKVAVFLLSCIDKI